MNKLQEAKSETLSPMLDTQQEGNATFIDNRPGIIQRRKLQQRIIQSSQSNTGSLPGKLQSGIERLSGYSMSDVQVHYNSAKPAQLGAHAYAYGNAIYLAPGQQQHLPHEAWHVVQQKQGRVKPTRQLKGKTPVNDNAGLEKEADTMGQKAILAGRSETAILPSPLNQMLPTVPVVQGLFYFGNQSLNKTELEDDLSYTLTIELGEPASWEFIEALADHLWDEYGNDQNKHMEMGAILKTAKKWKAANLQFINANATVDFINDLHKIKPGDINSPDNFHERIKNDTRLPDALQHQYIEAFDNSKYDRARYEETKTEAENVRANGIKVNTRRADEELKQGRYYKRHQKGDFREQIQRGEYLHEPQGQDKELIDRVLEHVEQRILVMKNELVGAWYYNYDDEQKIINSKEMQANNLRKKAAINEPQGFFKSKSPFVDVDVHRTGSYCFFFIEHENTYYKTHSRFNGPSTADGQLYLTQNQIKQQAGGKRMRFELNKLIKQGAIAIGGDLVKDREEVVKLRLKRNATNKKIIGSKSDVATDDALVGFLKNFCGFVKTRLKALLHFKPQKAKALLNHLEGMEGQQLWDYLTREIAQPQLMVPWKLSLSMKSKEVDFQPPIHYEGKGAFDNNYGRLKRFRKKDMQQLTPAKIATMTVLQKEDPRTLKAAAKEQFFKHLPGADRLETATKNFSFILYTQIEGTPCWISYVQTKSGMWWECRQEQHPVFIGDEPSLFKAIEAFPNYSIYTVRKHLRIRNLPEPDWDSEFEADKK